MMQTSGANDSNGARRMTARKQTADGKPKSPRLGTAMKSRKEKTWLTVGTDSLVVVGKQPENGEDEEKGFRKAL